MPYEVRLDGTIVWPQRVRAFPPSTIRFTDPRRPLDVVFGSCRITRPHVPPYVLRADEHPDGQGVDALRAYALRLADAAAPRRAPTCSSCSATRSTPTSRHRRCSEQIAARDRPPGAPDDELADFREYAMAYREAWSDPAIRWLFSTVPVTMVFDDHEIHAEWRISQGWLDEMNAEPWFDHHIRSGLMAYWVFQHLGNLSPAELERPSCSARSGRPATPRSCSPRTWTRRDARAATAAGASRATWATRG